jgi:hypothetical protein
LLLLLLVWEGPTAASGLAAGVVLVHCAKAVPVLVVCAHAGRGSGAWLGG